VICNNIFDGGLAWGVLAFDGVQNVQIYNNVIINISDYDVGIYNGASGDIRNNIFYGEGGTDVDLTRTTGGNNLWYNPFLPVSIGLFGSDILNENPDFANFTATNFSLTAGSPAIDAGYPEPIVTNDIVGVTRPQGAAWDIGAYDYVFPGTNAPAIGTQPSSRTVVIGANVSFTVRASGAAPLSYRWRFDGTNLQTSARITGTTSPTLSISNAQVSDSGNYTVVVTNSAGSATSSVAALVVTLPPSCDPPPAGMVGWWPAEGNANDITFGTNNGTLMGGAMASAPGEVGLAFSFDGTNGYVEIPDSPVFHPAVLTIEAWVLFTSLDSAGSGGSPAGQQYIVFKQNSQSCDFEGFGLSKTRVSGSDFFAFTVSSASGQSADLVSGNAIATGQWHHIAGVRGTNFIQLFVDGQFQGQTNVSFAQDYGILPLYFGTSGESYWDHKLAGELDEVSLYNVALSSNQIAAIYAAGSAGKCKGVGSSGARLLAPTKAAGTYSFTLMGVTGSVFSVQVSSNLQQWSDISTVTLVNGSSVITQPLASAPRFYRVRLLP